VNTFGALSLPKNDIPITIQSLKGDDLPRLPHDAVDYIKTADASYSKIIAHVEKQHGRKISKGLVSYYRGERRGRTKPFHKENASHAEWDWLVGLYYADGCKFKSRGDYVIVLTLSKNEREILDKLFIILSKMDLKAGKYFSKDNTVYIRVFSKHFYLTLPNKENPYLPRFPLAYLAGLMDGDGYMKRERWVFSQAKYPHLAKQVLDIGREYGDVTVMIQKPTGTDRKIPIYRVSFLKNARENFGKSNFAEYSIRYKSLLKPKAGPAGRI